MSSRILITTEPRDVHAIAVALGLARLGQEASLWYGADLPLALSTSFRLSDDMPVSWRASGPDLAFADPQFDTVWYRRHNVPFVGDRVHPEDRDFADKELRLFDRAVWTQIARDAFWVNPVAQFDVANSKLRQLTIARAAGFAIPDTLMSNDPAAIRRFVGEKATDGVVYKTFFPSRWELADGGRAFLPTTEIAADALPEDDVLRLTPGIFQAKVPKAYEIRVTVMGRECVAARIESQKSESARGDWRFDLDGSVTLAAMTLPEETREKCLGVMRDLGIVFGCFDLIVTPAGETVFLEVNEMGQFLWVETALPHYPLLDMFCRFLIEARADFRYRPGADPLAFHGIQQDPDYEAALARSESQHVNRRRPQPVPESAAAGKDRESQPR
mgnify:CR=1 FL=1